MLVTHSFKSIQLPSITVLMSWHAWTQHDSLLSNFPSLMHKLFWRAGMVSHCLWDQLILTFVTCIFSDWDILVSETRHHLRWCSVVLQESQVYISSLLISYLLQLWQYTDKYYFLLSAVLINQICLSISHWCQTELRSGKFVSKVNMIAFLKCSSSYSWTIFAVWCGALSCRQRLLPWILRMLT